MKSFILYWREWFKECVSLAFMLIGATHIQADIFSPLRCLTIESLKMVTWGFAFPLWDGALSFFLCFLLFLYNAVFRSCVLSSGCGRLDNSLFPSGCFVMVLFYPKLCDGWTMGDSLEIIGSFRITWIALLCAFRSSVILAIWRSFFAIICDLLYWLKYWELVIRPFNIMTPLYLNSTSSHKHW